MGLGISLTALALAGLSASAQEQSPRTAPPPVLNLPAPANGAVAPANGAAPVRPVDPLSQELSLEVRSAILGELTEKLADSLKVGLDVDPDLAGHSITLLADETQVSDLQNALSALFGTGWQKRGEGAAARYYLPQNADLQLRAQELMKERRTLFLNNLLQTGRAVQQQGAPTVARDLRAGVARRLTYLPQEEVNEISADYVRQTLLLAPLPRGMGAVLTRSGSAWTPFRTLPAAYQQLFASFFVEQYQAGGSASQVVDGRSNPLILNYPQARLEYRLLHGDRWTGPLLLTRVGASDNWANSYLPASLYNLPDYSTLYPEVAERPTGPEVRRPLEILIDTEKMNWDQALLHLARTAKINVLSDAFPRPMVFRPAGRGPIIGGTDVGHTLDRLCDYYGYFWWKEGNFYLFRNRLWAEEEKVAVPQRVRQQIGQRLSRSSRLATQDLISLAALSDEQLLSMRLYGAAAGEPYAPPDAFDFNEIQVVRAGLNLLGQMNDAQREQARAEGLPFLLMSPAQQYIFASTAYDRGLVLNPEESDQWRIRFSDHFERQRLPSGWSEVGELRVDFQYGANTARRAILPIRVPAAVAPPGAAAAAAAPVAETKTRPVVSPKTEIEIPKRAPGSR